MAPVLILRVIEWIDYKLLVKNGIIIQIELRRK